VNSQAPSGKGVTDLPFAMYDAFTAVPYSGSQAAVVQNASAISPDNRVRIAREIGAPATSFVGAIEGNRITVQFYSTVMELPMCGHGTICLMTRLVESGQLPSDGEGWHVAVLDLPKGEARVEYRRNEAGRIDVMLDVAVPQFTPAKLDLAELTQILGVDLTDISAEMPLEVASADFIHLCLPMRDLDAMGKLQPDFTALADFCVANGLDTVAAFCNEVVDQTCNLHVRDFCPAVGVAESAAAGTTNAALSSYLLRNNLVHTNAAGKIQVRAEQGIELGRPSNVTTLIESTGESITRLQVGGVATRIMDGVLNTEFDAHPISQRT
jgi:trans-2,3-dihydro-3-hydroxyanthranilate isomerase